MDDDARFLDAYDPAAFERLSVAVDVVLLQVREGALEVPLVRRGERPQQGFWSLPGGFVRPDESLDDAAARVLAQKAGLDEVFIEQLYSFGEPGRDPRTRVISVAYYALVNERRLRKLALASDRSAWARIDVPWEDEVGGPVRALDPSGAELALAFDHADILGMAVKRIRGKLHYSPIGFQLLPDAFTLRELQEVHEVILGRSLNKDSFRRKMLASGSLEATGRREGAVVHRPAELYRFVRRSAV